MADARLQVTIDAVDNASKQIKSVGENLNRFGAQARQVGIAMSLMGGAALAGMTLAIKSTADGQKAMEALGETTGKLRDTIGQALVPVIVQLNAVLQPVVSSLVAFIKEHPRLVQGMMLAAIAVAALGTTLIVLGTGLRAAVAAFEILNVILPLILGLVNKLTGGMVVLRTTSLTAWAAMALPVVAFAAALLLAQHALVELQKSFGRVPQNAKSELEKLKGVISELVDDMVGALIPAAAKFGAEFMGATSAAADGVQAVIDKILKLRDAEERVAQAAADVGAHWVSLGAQTEDFLERVFGPQVEAAQEKLITLGLGWQQAWNVAQMQVAHAVEVVMEKMAAGSSQGAAVMEAFRRGALSMAEAWVALGGKIEDVIALLREMQAVGGGVTEGMELTPWGASAQAAIAQNIADVAAGKFNEPAMQHGGIVTRPTRALIGEAGPEAVIPLATLGSNKGALSMFNIYLQLDGRTIASILGGQAAITENVRSS